MRFSIVRGIGLLIVLTMTGPGVQAQEAQSKREQAMSYARQAGPFLKEHDYASAVPLLRQSCESDDSFAAAHCNLGMALTKLNQFDEGRRELEKATQLDPNLAPPWIDLGPIYIGTGDLAAAAHAYERFLALCGDSPERAKAEASLANVKQQLATSALNGAADYFDIVIKRGAYIWNRQKMPLKVFVASGAGVEGYKPEYGQILRTAFADWSQASGSRITFVETPDPNTADISVDWSHDPARVKSPSEGGQETSRFQMPWGLQHADIVIMTCDQPGIKLSDLLMGWITHHEVGHALGINGHSPDPHDIMYFSGTALTTSANISQRDANTLARLYSNF